MFNFKCNDCITTADCQLFSLVLTAGLLFFALFLLLMAGMLTYWLFRRRTPL